MKKLAKIFKKIIRSFRSKKTLLLPLFVLLIFLSTRGDPDQKLIKTVPVVEKTLQSQVSASGVIRPQTSASLKFLTGGKVVWVGANKGNYVKKGQVIATLDKEPFEIALRQAEQDVNTADAILSQVYDEQQKQTAAENFDQKIRRTNAETAKNKTFDAMKKAQFDLKNTRLMAPVSGVITDFNITSGEIASIGQEIGRVENLDKLEFVTEIDEVEIASIQIGQSAQILLDAYSDKPIASHVERIAKKSTTTSTGATAFEVTIPAESSQNLLSGMNGEAEIIIEQKDHTLTVPQEVIVDERFVWLKIGAWYQKTEISTGISSETEVEILSGLDKNQEVVIAGLDQISKTSLWQKITRR